MPLVKTEKEARDFHIRRIAFLIDNDTDDDLNLVLIANFTDDPPRFHFYDGNHRVAAAYIRGDPTITLKIASDDEDRILRLLPGLTKLHD